MSQRFCVITGTSRGVGRAAALRVAEKGLVPLLVGRTSEEAAKTEALLAAQGAPHHSFECDLSDRSSVDQVAQAILGRFGAPELVIHNAGIVRRSSVSETSDALWDEQFEVNVGAPFRLTRAFLPKMLEAGKGRIVFISSISAVVGTPRQAAYNASKAALVGLMRCLAEELTDSALMTLALLPGAIDTDMLSGSGYVPRMTPDDVARAVVYYGLDAPRAHNGAAIEMFGV